MKFGGRGFTIVEVIIATLIFSIIFSGLYSSIVLIADYVKNANINFSAMSLTKSGIEKFSTLKSKKYIESQQDKWSSFMSSYNTGYYVFSGAELISKNPDNIEDYANWEGPLDASGKIKSSTTGLSFYRLVKIADYIVESENNNGSIFDCDKNTICKSGVVKKNLSSPYISKSVLSGDKIELFFSTGTVFSTPSIFIVYGGDRNAPYTFESNIDVQSTGILPNIGPVMSIDFSSFSGANYTGLANKYITLSGATSNGTFRFGDNLNLDGSLDKAVYNLRNIIRDNFEDFNAYIFYPNTCTIGESLFMYDSNKDTSFLFPRDLLGNCDATHISSSQTGIALTGTHILSYDESMTLKPQYALKIKDSESTASGHLLFSDLKSLRVPYFGVRLGGSGYSSIYNVGVRVVGVEYGQIKSDQFIQSYITDSDY